jgi:hypothetical protein
MKSTVEDEKLKGKLSDEDKQKIMDKCNEVISWLDKNQVQYWPWVFQPEWSGLTFIFKINYSARSPSL